MDVSHISHDAFFRASMEKLSVASEFFKHHLPDFIKPLNNLRTLKLEADTFVSKPLRKYYTDLLYSVEIKQQPGYLFILAEHKSYGERFLPLQLWTYLCQIWQRHRRIHKKKQVPGHQKSAIVLPLVVPLVFYHGEVSPYPYSTDLSDCFEDSQLAAKLLYGALPIVDVTNIPDEELSTHGEAAVLKFYRNIFFVGI